MGAPRGFYQRLQAFDYDALTQYVRYLDAKGEERTPQEQKIYEHFQAGFTTSEPRTSAWKETPSFLAVGVQ